MVIKQDFFIEKEANLVMTKHHSSLLFQMRKEKYFLFSCVYQGQEQHRMQVGNVSLDLIH